MRSLAVGIGIGAICCAIGGCSSSDSGTAGGAAAAGKSGGGSSGKGGNGSGGLNIGGGGTGAGAGGGTGGTIGGNEDTCDGVDNDGNGIIDDVDVGKDGVCDCLRIATLGLPGTVGVGTVFEAWLDARSNNGATDLNDAVLTPDVLAKYQVIVSQNVSKIGRSYSQSEVDALSAWVKAGGGFMTMIGYADPSEIANVNLLLGSFGMSYGPTQILQKSGSDTVPITNWVTHPVTQGVSLVGIDNGYPVQGSGTTLASEGGWDVLKVQEVSPGHVLMWGDEWITFNSEWQGHPEYQVELFWLNMIKWLTPAAECQVPIPPPVR